MSSQTHIRMVHAETGEQWDAPRRYVGRAEEKGFRLATAAEPAEVTAPAGDPANSLFDPTSHTVDEVQTYLGAASEEEITRVLDAERAGKNRTTITGD